MKYLKNGMISFAISAFSGLFVNLFIDLIIGLNGVEDYISMSPDYRGLFPTPVIGAYVNVLLYGLIGFTFSTMTFIYDMEKISFLVQSLIYFVVTATVCMAITVLLWQLHKYPAAFATTIAGYAATHIIMFTIEYRRLKKDIQEINEAAVMSVSK
ncbi:MAG: DUF3021 domain-containing protein [Lachnospiraceae bacterium]|nr:DUF3021 domain-containing protein [Lachnospiraceae bacterium]